MNLIINGEDRTFSEIKTLGALVDQLGMKPDRVAIELNRAIVARDQWLQTALRDGDRLEIVHFVGGGLHDNDSEVRMNNIFSKNLAFAIAIMIMAFSISL